MATKKSVAESGPVREWNPADRMLTTRDMMDFLNISRAKIWMLIKKSSLPAYRIGGDYRYRMSEILQWLETQKAAGDPEL